MEERIPRFNRNLKERTNTRIVLEEVDFIWGEDEYKACRKMWNKGLPIEEIAGELEREDIEVLMCILDLFLAAKISPRNFSFFKN